MEKLGPNLWIGQNDNCFKQLLEKEMGHPYPKTDDCGLSEERISSQSMYNRSRLAC